VQAKTSQNIVVRFEVVKPNKTTKITSTIQPDSPLMTFTFPCGITDLQYSYPSRLTIDRTSGGGWVNDWGMDLPVITLNTTISHQTAYTIKNPLEAMKSPLDFGSMANAIFNTERITGDLVLRRLKLCVFYLKSHKNTSELMAEWSTFNRETFFTSVDTLPVKADIWDDKLGLSEIYTKFYDFWNDEYWFVAINNIDLRQSKTTPFQSQISFKMTGLFKFDKPQKTGFTFDIYPQWMKDINSFISKIEELSNSMSKWLDRFGKEFQRWESALKFIASSPARLMRVATHAINAISSVISLYRTGLATPQILLKTIQDSAVSIDSAYRNLQDGQIKRSMVEWNNFGKKISTATSAYNSRIGAINRSFQGNDYDHTANADIETTPTRPGYTRDISKSPTPVSVNYQSAFVSLKATDNITNVLNISYNAKGPGGNNHGIKIRNAIPGNGLSPYNNGIIVDVYNRTDTGQNTGDIVATQTITPLMAKLMDISYTGNGIYNFNVQATTINFNVSNQTDRSKNTNWNLIDHQTPLNQTLKNIGDLITNQVKMFDIQYTGNATTASGAFYTNKITTTLSGDQTDGSEDLSIPITTGMRVKDLLSKVMSKDTLRIRYAGNASSALLSISSLTLSITLAGDQTDGTINASIDLSGKSVLQVANELSYIEAFKVQYTGNATTATILVKSNSLTISLAGDQTDGTLNLFANFVDYPTISDLVNFINTQTGYSATLTNNTATDRLVLITGIDVKTALTSMNARTLYDTQILWNTQSTNIIPPTDLQIKSFAYQMLSSYTYYTITFSDTQGVMKINELNPFTTLTLKTLTSVYAKSYFNVSYTAPNTTHVEYINRVYNGDQNTSLTLYNYNDKIITFLNGLGLFTVSYTNTTAPYIPNNIVNTDDTIHWLSGGK
jgi:hypothetical protein